MPKKVQVVDNGNNVTRVRSGDLNINKWKCELSGDPDEQLLLQGIMQGFRIVDEGVVVKAADMNNYQSAKRLRNRY